MSSDRVLAALALPAVLLLAACGGGTGEPPLGLVEVALSEMVAIPGNDQGWIWEQHNDYAGDRNGAYVPAGGYAEVELDAADPWGFNQPIPAIENTILTVDPVLAHYLRVGEGPTKVQIYGHVWDFDNDYYAFYLEAGTTVSWTYSGALSVTSELIPHPDLNPNGVVQMFGANSYRVDTAGFYFYKHERRGYSPADGTYDVPEGFPHFQTFKLEILFNQ